MNKTIKGFFISLLLTPLAGISWANDNATMDAVKHPVDSYHEHEMKEDAKDTQQFSQQQAEAKARMDEAKKSYEESLKNNGAENDVTKEAKKRWDDARKEYKKYAKKTAHAEKELQESTQKVNQDNMAH